MKVDSTQGDLWCERVTLGLTVALLLFGPLAMGAVRPTEFLVIDFLCVALVLVFIVRIWVSPTTQIVGSRLEFFVIAFLGYAIAKYFTSPLEFVARTELTRTASYAVVFFSISTQLKRAESFRAIALALIVLAGILSIFGIFQFVTHSGRIWGFVKPDFYLRRASGTYINPNHFAGFLEMVLPLALSFAVMGRFGHATKVVLVYVALLILVAIGLTISRGAWFATGFMAAGFCLSLLSQKRYWVPALATMLVFGVIACIFFPRAASSRDTIRKSFFADDRFLYWKPAISLWKQNSWVGIGPGHYDYEFRQFRDPHLQAQYRAGYVHNDYLNTLTDWGIVGLTLVVGTLVAFFCEARSIAKGLIDSRLRNEKRTTTKGAIVFGSIFGIVAIAFHSFLDFNMQIPANALIAVSLLSLGVGHRKFLFRTEGKPLAAWVKILLTLPSLAAAIFLSWQGWVRGTESLWLARAAQAKTINAQVECLKRAHQAEPNDFDVSYRIAETRRLQSFEGGVGYETQGREAIQWFDTAIRSNRFDPYSRIGKGMCLDWLDEKTEAWKFFEEALALDPKGFFTLAMLGWHAFQCEEYDKAKLWFERSLAANWTADNSLARTYLDLTLRKLSEPSILPGR